MRTILIALICLLPLTLPTAAGAACEGTDLRTLLSPAETAELDAALERVPYASGNHWTATKGDRTLHLIGTMHFNDPRMDAVLQRLEPLLAAADAILFEVRAAEMAAFEQALMQDPSRLLITDGPTLPELMSETAWARLSEIARARGMAPWMVAKMQPWLLGSVLSQPPCLLSDESRANGLDRRLDAAAERLGVPIHSLETVEYQFDLFAAAPMAEQIQMLELMLAGAAAGPDGIFTMTKAYFEEAHAEILGVARIDARRQLDLPAEEFDRLWQKFETDLLVTRNHNWLPQLLAHPGDRIVVAVGAGHLSGEDGVLNLLAEAGYELSRAPF